MRRLLVAGAVLVVACPANRDEQGDLHACLRAHAGVDARFEPVVRAFCAEIEAHELPGAALAMVENGTVALAIAHGRRCAGDVDPVLPSTPFRIGSVTKVFTAAATVALADEGRVDLDAPVRALGGAFFRVPAPVTLRALLDHRAGIAEHMPTSANAHLVGDALIDALTEGFDPAAGQSYSSAGYALAAAALERASGEPWIDAVRTRVAEPADVRVAIAADPGIADAAACGHLREGGSWRAYDVVDDFRRFAHGASWAEPAGGLIVSAPDVARLGGALATGSSSGTFSRMRSLLDAAPDGYVLGLRKSTLQGGEPLWQHRGDTGDFATELYVLPRHGLAIAVVANGPASLRATVLAALAAAGVDTRLP